MTAQFPSWLEKMVRRSRKTFRMSRKIDAARNGAELMSAERRSRWKSKHGEACEDHQADHRVDQRTARNAHEDQHDAEHDQGHQRPETGPRDRRQVAPGGVACRAEAGDEQGGRPACLPERTRVRARVVRHRRRHGQPDQQAEAAEQHDSQLKRPARREPHADQAGEGGDERDDAHAAGQAAAQVRAEREQSRGGRDISHRPREQGVRPIAGCHPGRLVYN